MTDDQIVGLAWAVAWVGIAVVVCAVLWAVVPILWSEWKRGRSDEGR